MQESANSALQQVLFNFYRLEIKNFYPTTRKSTLLQHSTKTSKSFCNLVGITFHASSRCGKDICKKKQPTPQKKVKKLFYSSLVFLILIFLLYFDCGFHLQDLQREDYRGGCVHRPPPVQEHGGGLPCHFCFISIVFLSMVVCW